MRGAADLAISIAWIIASVLLLLLPISDGIRQKGMGSAAAGLSCWNVGCCCVALDCCFFSWADQVTPGPAPGPVGEQAQGPVTAGSAKLS